MKKINYLQTLSTIGEGQIVAVQGRSVRLVLHGVVPILYRDGVEIPDFISPMGEIDSVDPTKFYAMFIAEEFSDKEGEVIPTLNFVRVEKALTKEARAWGVDTPRKLMGVYDYDWEV